MQQAATPRISICSAGPEFDEWADTLALRLQLMKVGGDEPVEGLRLECGVEGLQLCAKGLRPLCIDFGGDLARRGRVPGAELLVKAMGRGPRAGTRVIDATAGLGRDAFLLASAGFEVSMLEREPVLHALLEDGLYRAMRDPVLRETCSRLQLLGVDSRQGMTTMAADIVYLDPMFPEREGKAAVGRESQLLRLLAVPVAEEESELLTSARVTASRRVVVKRHRNAPALAGEAPSYQLRGRSTRFDVYLCN